MPILDREPCLYPDGLFAEEWEPGPERQWWAVFTRARQEKALARELVSYEIPFFLPLGARTNVIRGRRVNSYLPLFPGYLFLCGNDEERVRSLTTNRISRMLPVNDQMRLYHDLQHLHHLIEVDAPLTVENHLAPGNPVRIRSGPMQGVEGVVTSRRGRTRLLVAVQFLQNGVSVEIEDGLVEPL